MPRRRSLRTFPSRRTPDELRERIAALCPTYGFQLEIGPSTNRERSHKVVLSLKPVWDAPVFRSLPRDESLSLRIIARPATLGSHITFEDVPRRVRDAHPAYMLDRSLVHLVMEATG